ncbi:ABC transporter ATP-binding protein [Deinococcus radiophilus]|uniref:ABC transporter ATP-binding protein n=1 Tax=Deinococcus radiophilus TaxID=32062 RepID=A0A3S0I8R1_9DEIO|nr:ABC transporter ATP-binding protein [Deinococcus radiophilus]RTR27304.1 ABC transporter ATP-binding protein [Deinococcus radiophilus]UFA50608.1 ABC transporter ATP-binding protein/permease [Deinococcus radiophilus]
MDRNWQALWAYLYRHRRQYIIGIVAVAIANALALLPFYFIRLVIDGLTARIEGGSAAAITLTQIGWYAAGIAISALLSGALMLVMRRQIIVASREIEYEVRRDLFAHLQTLDQAYFGRARTGDLMNRLTGDLGSVRELLGFGAWQVVNIAASFATSLAVMFSLSWQLTLVVLALLPIIVGALFVLARMIHARHTAVQEQNSLIAAKAQENFSGARVVKGYAMESRELEDYRAMNLELLRRNIQLTKVDGPLRSFTSLLLGLAFGLVLLVGGRQILQGSGEFTVGMFVQFVGTLDRLAWPMMMVGWITSVNQRGLASWRRLVELFNARPEVGRVPDEAQTLPVRGELELKGVSLRYGDTAVLKDIDLHVPAGTFLGITGPTGSGKTSLAALLTRLVDPTEGQVLLDGRDLRAIPTTQLREVLGVVPQEPFLFSDTLANNITFGLEHEQLPVIPTGVSVLDVSPPPELPQNPDQAQVLRAAELAGLAGDVEGFPEGYGTLLGERGVTLSGGQRQRTAIARAIAREPRVLILDDSLSAVDTETERQIIDGLREVSRGRTVILIAHRISTLRHADTIAVLDEGRLVEQGSHAELLALGGHYAELDRLQQLSSEIEEDTGQATASGATLAGGRA